MMKQLLRSIPPLTNQINFVNKTPCRDPNSNSFITIYIEITDQFALITYQINHFRSGISSTLDAIHQMNYVDI